MGRKLRIGEWTSVAWVAVLAGKRLTGGGKREVAFLVRIWEKFG